MGPEAIMLVFRMLSFKLTFPLSFFTFIKRLLNSLFSGGSDGKESSCKRRRHGFNPWVRKIPWRWEWQPTLVLLPGEFHGQRSQVGYSPWSHKELEMTERHSISLFAIRMEPRYPALQEDSLPSEPPGKPIQN